ncbi:hypothetical protein GOV09_03395 [Candidatus Woesearchaeota archaeon]|nr:hypothetical protein [Candidatus Woesearchaeota archaeon]
MQQKEQLKEIIDVLTELCEEGSIPRNVKAKFQDVCNSLKKSTEISVMVNQALHELDEVGDDNNLQPYIRTQIWNIVSLLEKVSS